MAWLPGKSRSSGTPGLSGGVLAGAAGHVALAAWILLGFAAANTAEERGASVLPTFLELFLAPGVLVLALVRSFDRRTRARAGGLVIGTVLGLLLVTAVTLTVQVR
jgi:hypothetical protein